MAYEVKEYGLKRKMYVPIKIGGIRSYGGRQQWFSKEVKETKDLKAYFTHFNGCGVIALSDLFFYLAMSLPNGKETRAGAFIDTYGNVSKESYMTFVEIIREEYARIYGSCGTFLWELTGAINRYCKDNKLEIRAYSEVGISQFEMLRKIQKQLEHNYPVILMIGQSSPVILSKIRKVGIPFFKQLRIRSWNKEEKAYAEYNVVEKNVYGHFVMITGIIIDEKASWSSQKIMLRIASWGEEYYISYEHYCRYMRKISKPWLCGMITLH